MENNASGLPTTSAERKAVPLARGCLDYFPAALAAVAELSWHGNDKHNPGEELHHARGKSSDHADCIMRHLMDRGTLDPEDGLRHSVKVAWRALALLQEELEAAGAPVARGARLPECDDCDEAHATGPCPPNEANLQAAMHQAPVSAPFDVEGYPLIQVDHAPHAVKDGCHCMCKHTMQAFHDMLKTGDSLPQIGEQCDSCVGTVR